MLYIIRSFSEVSKKKLKFLRSRFLKYLYFKLGFCKVMNNRSKENTLCRRRILFLVNRNFPFIFYCIRIKAERPRNRTRGQRGASPLAPAAASVATHQKRRAEAEAETLPAVQGKLPEVQLQKFVQRANLIAKMPIMVRKRTRASSAYPQALHKGLLCRPP